MDFGARIGRFNKWMMLVVYPFYLYLVSVRVHLLPPIVATPLVPAKPDATISVASIRSV